MVAMRCRIFRLTAALASGVVVAACQPGVPTAPSVVQQTAGSTPRAPRVSSGPTLVPGTSILAGTLVEGVVDGGDPDCFPDWDASGHCRQYDFTALADGMMFATLQWPEPSRGLYNPDVFLVAHDGTWVYAPDGPTQKQARLVVKAGLVYHVVVLSYGTVPQAFRLTVGLE